MTSPPSQETARFTLEEEGACTRRLHVTVDAASVESEVEAAARSLGKSVRLPGFRKGKVPVAVIRKRYSDDLKEDVIQSLASRLVPPYLEREGLVPVASPMVEKETYAPGKELEMTILFEVQPPVTLGEYRGLKAARPDDTVTDKDVADALDSIRQQMARLRTVEDRGSKDGDEMEVELTGEYIEGEEAGESFSRPDLRLQVGTEDLHPDLSEALREARPGEERQVRIRYPDDYRTDELAGRLIHYTMKVKTVQERQVADLDDEFARDVGDFENLEALKTKVREDLQNDRARRADEEVRQALMRQLEEGHPLEVPKVLVEREMRRRLEAMAGHLAQQGVDPAQSGIEWEKEAERLRKQAAADIRVSRILDAVGEKESLEPDDEQVEAFYRQEAAREKKSAVSLRAAWQKDGRDEALRRQLRRERVLDFLISVGHIHEEGKNA